MKDEIGVLEVSDDGREPTELADAINKELAEFGVLVEDVISIAPAPGPYVFTRIYYRIRRS